MDVAFRPRHKFPKHLGGTDADSTSGEDSEWRGGSESAAPSTTNLTNNSSWIEINSSTTRTYNKQAKAVKKDSYVELSNAYAQLAVFSADPPNSDLIPLCSTNTSCKDATDVDKTDANVTIKPS